MKTHTVLASLCLTAALASMTSCLGMTDAIVPDYGIGYDNLWYNGFGYGNNYYGGYYGPNYGYGPGLPPPPPPQRPVPPQQPSQPGASTPLRPAVPTTPSGTQRPGNNGLPSTPSAPSVRPGFGGNSGGSMQTSTPVRREPASPTQTTTGRGRK